MSAPTAVPSGAELTRAGLTPDGLWQGSFRSMASPVRVQLATATPDPHQRLRDVRRVFDEVCDECTRFEATSDLMRANRAGDGWCEVGRWCLAALAAAEHAHRRTGGLFDPRVLTALAGLGYGPGTGAGSHDLSAPWRPDVDAATGRVRIGPVPVDLGGIGKGLALRWAAAALRRDGATTFLIDAGGDCVAAGAGPSCTGWNIGVEDPFGAPAPVAVLGVTDTAVATSSTRLLRWRHEEQDVHHLIDPRTGAPGGRGLAAVTVVDDDPADAEVHSKTLFLHGTGIGAVADELGVAALWVHDDGRVGLSREMVRHVVWTRP